MFAGLFTILIAGSIKEGGAAEIYHVNKLSGRMDIFEWVNIVFYFSCQTKAVVYNSKKKKS